MRVPGLISTVTGIDLNQSHILKAHDIFQNHQPSTCKLQTVASPNTPAFEKAFCLRCKLRLTNTNNQNDTQEKFSLSGDPSSFLQT